MTWDVVIPAGGVIDAAYAQVIGTPHRALAPFGPQRTPVLQVVVDALRVSGAADRIIVVAPVPVAKVVLGVDCWLESGDFGMENIRRGLEAASPDRPALVCTCDLPLITPEHVRDFVRHCDVEADISVGIVTAAEYQERFPDAPASTFVALRDAGPVTIGGLFQVHSRLVHRHTALFSQVFGARKSQLQMARLLGPRLLWQWFRKTLTLTELIAHAERRLTCRVDIVCSLAPEFAFDIDTLHDYAYAQTRFQPAADRSS